MSTVVTKVTTFVNTNKKALLIAAGVVAVLAVVYWYRSNSESYLVVPQPYLMGGGRPMHGPSEGFYANLPQGGQGGQMGQMPQMPQMGQAGQGGQRHEPHQSAQGAQGNDESRKLVLFYAPWCPHCKDLLQPNDNNGGKPAWSLLKQKHAGRKDISIDEVDCDAKPELASKYEVKGFPTVILFKGNQKLNYDGDRSLESLEKFLETQ